MTGSQLFTKVITHLHLERFFYGEGPEARPITLDRHRVFILPTREGMLFASVMGVMLVGATNYDNSMGYFLTFLLAGFGLMSMLHTYRNLAQLTFRAGYCAPIFAGEKAQYTLFIDNQSALHRFALTLSLNEGPDVRIDVPAHSVARAMLSRPAPRRGYQPMERCTVSTRFPVGLFRAWAYIDPGVRCLAYPRPAMPRPLPALQPSERQRGESRGQGTEDFTGLRQYVPGDSPRHIAWKQAAHDGELLTKQFAGEGMVQRWLTWDDVASLEAEERLSVLCRWVLTAHVEGQSYGLRLPGAEYPPALTPAHRDACLRALALYGME